MRRLFFTLRYLVFASIGLFFCAVPTTLFAGKIDYSKLSDEEIKLTVIFTVCLLFVSAIIGIVGWIRYLRSYQPQPGTFTPMQALGIVLLLIGGVIVFALFELQLL